MINAQLLYNIGQEETFLEYHDWHTNRLNEKNCFLEQPLALPGLLYI